MIRALKGLPSTNQRWAQVGVGEHSECIMAIHNLCSHSLIAINLDLRHYGTKMHHIWVPNSRDVFGNGVLSKGPDESLVEIFVLQ